MHPSLKCGDHKRSLGDSNCTNLEPARKIARMNNAFESCNLGSSTSDLEQPGNSKIIIDLDDTDSDVQTPADSTDLALEGDPMELDPHNVGTALDPILISTTWSPDHECCPETQEKVSVTDSATPTSDFYDICFGMLKLSISSSVLPTRESVPVEMRIHGDLAKFHLPRSGRYVGLLQSHTLGQLAEQFMVTFSCLLQRPNEEPKASLQRSRKLEIHIVIYGLLSEFDAVGHLLCQDGLYLQHPEQFDKRVPYKNPQFLLPPGFDMPEHKSENIEDLPEFTDADESLAHLSRKQMNDIFQTFDSANGPSTYTKVGPSLRLKTQLEEHQIKALSMMAEKEQNIVDQPSFPSLWDVLKDSNGDKRYRHTITGITKSSPPPALCGGILADEMGLGKTLSMLALIALHLDSIDRQSTVPRATLIVTTLSTITSWQQQAERHFHPGQLQTGVFHGSDRRKLSSDSIYTKDIIITTYETLKSEWCGDRANSPLFSETKKWSRVVLDEAHHVRNRSSQVFKAVCGIRAQYRWCLTGTPIHNRMDDYGALLSFIGVHPFNGPSGKNTFSYWISPYTRSQSQNTAYLDRLKRLVAATCLRRTKQIVKNQLKLSRRNEVEKLIELSTSERLLYNFFKVRASSLTVENTVDREVIEGGGHGILSFINSLRLICNHGEKLLNPSALKIWKARDTSFDDLGPRVKTSPQLCNESSPDPRPEDSLQNLPTPEHKNSDNYTPSSKVTALIETIRAEQNGNSCKDCSLPVKSVVFSYWTKMLDLIEVALRANNFNFERIDGQTSLDRRSQAMKKLQDDPRCTVMLASIGSIAEGVDLTAASRVHVIEPQWNPMVEAQAIDRVHRMGQKEDVLITRYIVKDSIETYVQEVQKAKLKMAREPFDKISEQATANECRLHELRKLFL